MDCLPAGMELFPAGNEDQWTLIQGVIDASDYYLVVVGGRYGSTTEEGISYTEKEYNYAIEKGIPVMGFVPAEPGKIPKDKLDMDPKAQKRLAAFQAKVQNKITKRWNNASDLQAQVIVGLAHLQKKFPRPGWVRGDMAMTEETRTQIAELQAALSKAEKDVLVRDKTTSSEIDITFAHGKDKVGLSFGATLTDSDHKMYSTSGSYEVTWDYIVRRLGVAMLAEAPEKILRDRLNSGLSSLLKRRNYSEYRRVTALITDDSWGTVIIQLRALGIITTGTKRRTVSDRTVYWALTPAGDDYLVGLRAHKRVADVDTAVEEIEEEGDS